MKKLIQQSVEESIKAKKEFFAGNIEKIETCASMMWSSH